MELNFFSDWTNIVSVLFLFLFTFLCFICLCLESKNKLDKFFNYFIVLFLFLGGSHLIYYDNYETEDSIYQASTLSDLSININTFKEYENRLPKTKDFYLSSFLNDSQYFEIKDNKKIFSPIHNSNFILKDNIDTLSFSYTKNYDDKSFKETGKAYRSCLNFPINLRNFNFEQIKVSINGKDFDYKKATKKSMKDICYLDKPNNYQITFF